MQETPAGVSWIVGIFVLYVYILYRYVKILYLHIIYHLYFSYTVEYYTYKLQFVYCIYVDIRSICGLHMDRIAEAGSHICVHVKRYRIFVCKSISQKQIPRQFQKEVVWLALAKLADRIHKKSKYLYINRYQPSDENSVSTTVPESEAYHSQPIQQAKYRFTELTKRNGVFSPEDGSNRKHVPREFQVVGAVEGRSHLCFALCLRR